MYHPSPVLATVLLIAAATWFLSLRRRRKLPPGPFPVPHRGQHAPAGIPAPRDVRGRVADAEVALSASSGEGIILLLPRKAESDEVVNGYLIPKEANVAINVWAIGRDPTFEPERFLDQKIDFKGQNYELIPFGSGRRICPGMPLADRVLHTVVATLAHNFDWKLQGPEASDAHRDFLCGLCDAKGSVPFKA